MKARRQHTSLCSLPDPLPSYLKPFNPIMSEARSLGGPPARPPREAPREPSRCASPPIKAPSPTDRDMLCCSIRTKGNDDWWSAALLASPQRPAAQPEQVPTKKFVAKKTHTLKHNVQDEDRESIREVRGAF